MTAGTPRCTTGLVVDVAVVGGGLAGLATATHLARSGKRVACIEPRPWPRPAVGESLEFSAPRLLADLGIDIGRGAEPRPVFPKTSVRITGDDTAFTVWPPAWFARPPIWLSRQTFHCDRTELDLRLMHLAVDEGVEIVPERVTRVDRDHDVITGLTTDGRTHIRAAWFVDATGHSCRLFGRALDLDLEALGAPRAAFWTRLREPPDGHATRLYFPEADADDLTWAWEIPLNADEVSIGLVMSAAEVTRLRHRGLRPREILEHQLAAIPSLGRVLGAHPDVGLHATAYTPYRHRRTLGPNWILVGDAASMVDPLTSNGVTSALRHAEQAARTVSNARDHDKLGRRHGWAYRNTAPSAVRTLDRAIEAFLYDPGVRRRVGLRWAVNLYAATGVITNSLYARINPATPRRAVVCAGMLAVSRLWIRAASTMLSGRAPAGARRQPQIGPRPTGRPQWPSARRPASRRPRRRSRLGRGLHTRQGHRGRPSWSPGSPRFETRAHGEGGTRGTGS